MARRLKLEVSVDGYFIEEHPGDDSGFVSDEKVDKALDFLVAFGITEIPPETVAIILASTIRDLPE